MRFCNCRIRKPTPFCRAIITQAVCAIALLVLVVANPAIACQDEMAAINPNMQPKLEIDLARVEAAGIRVLAGKHVTIYTDVRNDAGVNELPEVFDAAIPFWGRYFGVEEKRMAAYKLSGFVMADKTRFKNAGLIPDSLPPFPAGLNRGHEMWVFHQRDSYYTRHLLIHEGTHAFMQWFGGGVGAPWYSEGMAELLAVHAWQDKTLSMNFRLTDRSQSPGWGRPKILKEDYANGKFMTIDEVMQFPNNAFREVRSYAWSWAACEFFSTHPLTRDRFNAMQKSVDKPIVEFNEMFYKSIRSDLGTLTVDWHLFIAEMDYGYRVGDGVLSELAPVPGESAGSSFQLRTDRSWQRAVEVSVKTGDKIRISAKGRFKVGESLVGGQMTPWPCESNGITLDYYRSRPLGELHAMFLPVLTGNESQTDQHSIISEAIVSVQPIGLDKVITASNDGVLCLRINESPAKLDDNKGTLEIAVEKID